MHASYDTDKMQPKWNVDDLFTAMYMSLFYLRANNYIYKQCPHCGTYFIVSRTTSKKYIVLIDAEETLMLKRLEENIKWHKKRGTRLLV